MNFENMTDEEWADCRRRVEEGWLALTARRNIEEWVNGLNEARQQVERLTAENAQLKADNDRLYEMTQRDAVQLSRWSKANAGLFDQGNILWDALKQIAAGVDHPDGLYSAPDFYRAVEWAQGIARDALDAIKRPGASASINTVPNPIVSGLTSTPPEPCPQPDQTT